MTGFPETQWLHLSAARRAGGSLELLLQGFEDVWPCFFERGCFGVTRGVRRPPRSIQNSKSLRRQFVGTFIFRVMLVSHLLFLRCGKFEGCLMFPVCLHGGSELWTLRQWLAQPLGLPLRFLTSRGNKMVRIQKTRARAHLTGGRENAVAYSTTNSLAREFEKLMRQAEITSRRGRGFYSLQHQSKRLLVNAGTRLLSMRSWGIQTHQWQQLIAMTSAKTSSRIA